MLIEVYILYKSTYIGMIYRNAQYIYIYIYMVHELYPQA